MDSPRTVCSKPARGICEVCEEPADRLISRLIEIGMVTACPDCWWVWDEDMAAASER